MHANLYLLALSLKKHDNLEPELVLKRSWSPNAFCGRTWEFKYSEATRAPSTRQGGAKLTAQPIKPTAEKVFKL